MEDRPPETPAEHDDDAAELKAEADAQAFEEELEAESAEAAANAGKARRQEFIDGLRELADDLEQRPEMPAPHYEELTVFSALEKAEGESESQWLARVVKATPGRLEKDERGDYMAVARRYGMDLKIVYYVTRDDVCTRKVVGQKPVKRKKVLKPAETEEVEEMEDIIEWECEPLLGRT